jgi:transposase-like protein
MVRPGRSKLKGTVEVDETLYGSLEEGHPGRGTEKKALIIIASELTGPNLGRIRMSIIPNANSESLMTFIKENVEAGSTVITDGWAGYSPIEKNGYSHLVHTVAKDKEALPHVHLVISLLKRWLLGTHQGGISHDQLDYYLDEFVFRFNRRTSKNRILIFHRIIENAVQARPVTYEQLVGGSKFTHDEQNT